VLRRRMFVGWFCGLGGRWPSRKCGRVVNFERLAPPSIDTMTRGLWGTADMLHRPRQNAERPPAPRKRNQQKRDRLSWANMEVTKVS
jgi:hypothetical protein